MKSVTQTQVCTFHVWETIPRGLCSLPHWVLLGQAAVVRIFLCSCPGLFSRAGCVFMLPHPCISWPTSCVGRYITRRWIPVKRCGAVGQGKTASTPCSDRPAPAGPQSCSWCAAAVPAAPPPRPPAGPWGFLSLALLHWCSCVLYPGLPHICLCSSHIGGDYPGAF